MVRRAAFTGTRLTAQGDGVAPGVGCREEWQDSRKQAAGGPFHEPRKTSHHALCFEIHGVAWAHVVENSRGDPRRKVKANGGTPQRSRAHDPKKSSLQPFLPSMTDEIAGLTGLGNSPYLLRRAA